MKDKVLRTYFLPALLMLLGALLHLVGQAGNHLGVIGDMAQEILIIVGLALIFGPVIYAMRYSLRQKPVAYLLFFGLTAKAGHLFLDTAEEYPGQEYEILDRSNPIHIVAKETLSAISVALLLAGLFCFVVMHRDAEQRLRRKHKELRDELKEKAKLSAAIEYASDAVVVTDNEGIVQYVNPRFETITGYTASEIIGSDIESRIRSGQHEDIYYREMWNTIQTGSDWFGTFINRRKDGTFYKTHASIAPICDSSGSIVSFVSVQRDLTKETELQEQVHHAKRMESVALLAGGIAHNLRNMLSSIIGWIEIAQDAKGDEELTSSSLHRAREIGDRATRQISDLLAFSHRRSINLQTINLSREASRAAQMLRSLIPKTIDLHVSADSDVHEIRADPDQILEIIMNLVMNAVDAVGANGLIEISVDKCVEPAPPGQEDSHTSSFVVLTIKDNGAGMTEETRSHIFEPFFTTKESGKGTGLGLSVVYGIAVEHNGSISVATELGKGTSVSISFPVIGGSIHASS